MLIAVTEIAYDWCSIVLVNEGTVGWVPLVRFRFCKVEEVGEERTKNNIRISLDSGEGFNQ